MQLIGRASMGSSSGSGGGGEAEVTGSVGSAPTCSSMLRLYLRNKAVAAADWMLQTGHCEKRKKRTTHPDDGRKLTLSLLFFRGKREDPFFALPLQKFLFTSLCCSVSIHKFTQSQVPLSFLLSSTQSTPKPHRSH